MSAGARRRATAPAAARRAPGAPADRRSAILRAAVRVFARRGFHACRVSDIAEEAGVGYGLVYHYFASKDEVLDTLFLERWNVMLEAIKALEGTSLSAREQLESITGFIVESYRHDPELMKVIIVEVTRAANSFGRRHLANIQEAYRLIGAIVERAQREGVFRTEIDARFAAMAFYGVIEQVLTGWIFGVLPAGDEQFERATQLVVEIMCGGLQAGR